MVENNYAFIYLGPLDNEDSAASPCTNHCHLTKNLSLSISKTRVAFCVLFGESRRLYFIASKQKQCFCHVGTWNHHHIKTSITLNTIPVCHSIVCQVRSMMVVLSRCILSLACMAMNKILCLKKTNVILLPTSILLEAKQSNGPICECRGSSESSTEIHLFYLTCTY